LSAATLDRVISEVVQEAFQTITKSLDEAQAEALRIVSKTLDEFMRERAAIEEAGRAEREAARQRILSTAEIQAKNMAIAAVEEEVGKVFETALSRLAKEAAGDGFKQVMERLLDEAVELIGKDIVVESNEKGIEMLREIVANGSYKVRITVSDKPIKTIGGLRAVSADGLTRLDNTLEARLERLKQSLRSEIAKMFLRKE
jgi:V/A-type H+/Na+-transporting ATPase subunit E